MSRRSGARHLTSPSPDRSRLLLEAAAKIDEAIIGLDLKATTCAACNRESYRNFGDFTDYRQLVALAERLRKLGDPKRWDRSQT